jgi:hypothetical protein
MKPKTYLFPGTVHNCRADVPINTKVPSEACRQAAHRAGIAKHVSPHTLLGTLAGAQPIWAQTWTTTKVVDNTTACLGSQGVFNPATLFPAISGPWVVFLDSGDDSCTSNDGPSIWSYNLITKALVKLVDTNTLIPFPAGAGNFVSLSYRSGLFWRPLHGFCNRRRSTAWWIYDDTARLWGELLHAEHQRWHQWITRHVAQPGYGGFLGGGCRQRRREYGRVECARECEHHGIPTASDCRCQHGLPIALPARMRVRVLPNHQSVGGRVHRSDRDCLYGRRASWRRWALRALAIQSHFAVVNRAAR